MSTQRPPRPYRVFIALAGALAILAHSASAGDTRFVLRFVGSRFDSAIHWVSPSVPYIHDDSVTFSVSPPFPENSFAKELSFQAQVGATLRPGIYRPTYWPDDNFPQIQAGPSFILRSLGAPSWGDLPDGGGELEIKEYTRRPDGTVASFWATFWYPYLEGGGPVIGELRYNATVGDETPNAAPTLAVPDAVVTRDARVLLDAVARDDAKPFGAPLTVRWTKIAGPDGATLDRSTPKVFARIFASLSQERTSSK